MGRVETKLEPDLETKLRMKALTKFGGKKGSLALALVDAIEQYVNEDTGAELVKAIKDKNAPKAARRSAADALAMTGYGSAILAKIVADSNSDGESRLIASDHLMTAHYREQGLSEERQLDPQKLAEARIRADAEVRSRRASSQASREGGSE